MQVSKHRLAGSCGRVINVVLPRFLHSLQVSEHASWSAGYYGRMINAVLATAGAPPDLVQFVTGYAEAGNALVTGGRAIGWQGVGVRGTNNRRAQQVGT